MQKKQEKKRSKHKKRNRNGSFGSNQPRRGDGWQAGGEAKRNPCLYKWCQTTPVNPMNAMAKMPAMIRAMGVPFMPLGASIRSTCSRMPANSTKAKAKPKAMPTATRWPVT